MNPPEAIKLSGEIGHLATMKDGRIISIFIFAEHAVLKDLDREYPPHPVYLRFSSDGGRTWTEPARAFDFPAGKGKPGSLLLLVDREGNVHLFSCRYFQLDYSDRNAFQGHSIVLHNVSRDGGKTWSEPKEIDYGHRYCGNFNCALQLESGRLLLPMSYFDFERKDGTNVVMTVYSDDGGETWGRSNDCPVSGGGAFFESGSDEPVAVELKGGLVWMLMRTTTGYFWETFSNDGAIWTPPIGTRLVSSNAPGGILRLADGRIVLFWNNLYGEPYHGGGISYARQKLFGAISRNEGQTWSAPRVVARIGPGEPVKAQTTYPFLCQAPDGAIVLLYYHVHTRWAPEMLRIDPDWLEGN